MILYIFSFLYDIFLYNTQSNQWKSVWINFSCDIFCNRTKTLICLLISHLRAFSLSIWFLLLVPKINLLDVKSLGLWMTSFWALINLFLRFNVYFQFVVVSIWPSFDWKWSNRLIRFFLVYKYNRNPLALQTAVNGNS